MVGCSGPHWRHQLRTTTNVGPCSPCLPNINLTIADHNPREITVTSHGLVEIKEPRLVSLRLLDEVLVVATTNDQELEVGMWMAVGIVDEHTLLAYHVELLSSLYEQTFPLANFDVDHYYWLGADGKATTAGSPPDAHEVVLWYALERTVLAYAYDVKEFGSTTLNLFSEDEVWSEFMSDILIPAGTGINMNGPTPPYTSQIDAAHAWNQHNARTSLDFNQFYPVKLAAYLSGGTGFVSQGDIYRDDNDGAGYVRFAFDILPGVKISFKSIANSPVT